MKLPTQRFDAVHFPRWCQLTARKISKMDWVPIVFITFKVLVFGTCMFYAIKWHHDQAKTAKEEASRSQTLVERTPGVSE